MGPIPLSQWFGLLFPNLSPDLHCEILNELTAKEIRNLCKTSKVIGQIRNSPKVRNCILSKRARWTSIQQIFDLDSQCPSTLNKKIKIFIKQNPQRFPTPILNRISTKYTFINLASFAQKYSLTHASSTSSATYGYREYLCFCEDEKVQTVYNKVFNDRLDLISHELDPTLISGYIDDMCLLFINKSVLTPQITVARVINDLTEKNKYFVPFSVKQDQFEYLHVEIPDVIGNNMLLRFGVADHPKKEFILVNRNVFLKSCPSDEFYKHEDISLQIKHLIKPELQTPKHILNSKLIKLNNMFKLQKVTANVFSWYRRKVINYSKQPPGSKEEVHLFLSKLEDVFVDRSSDFVSRRLLNGTYLISIRKIPNELKQVWFDLARSSINGALIELD